MTYEAIRKLATEFYNLDPRNEVACEVINMVDCARVNADDTCFVEKSRPDTEYHQIAMDSLEMQLAYASENQTAAVAWFVSQGVKF